MGDHTNWGGGGAIDTATRHHIWALSCTVNLLLGFGECFFILGKA